MTATPMQFSALPALGAPLDKGTFQGALTQPDGTHAAVVLLPERGTGLTWQAAMDWAKELGGELPTRPAAAMLFAYAKASLPNGWHWTNEEFGASYAWGCYFYHGQGSLHKSYVGSAVAVRLIPLTPAKTADATTQPQEVHHHGV